jgi:hypothetical protein
VNGRALALVDHVSVPCSSFHHAARGLDKTIASVSRQDRKKAKVSQGNWRSGTSTTTDV